MRASAIIPFLFCAVAAAAPQNAAIPDDEVPQRKEVFRNDQVAAFLVEIAPSEATPMHQHDRDFFNVFLTKGSQVHTVRGKGAIPGQIVPGTVRFRRTGFTHATRNVGKAPLRMATVEFAEPQGKSTAARQRASRYCNPDNPKACVDEKYLFCTEKICVEDVTIAPGAVTTRHSHPTDHMLVAVSDYELTDEAQGAGTTVRTRKSGEVEYFEAGITHQLTNTGKAPARFIVVVFR
jgi:quercetin dioxygenase-like cupin family protein